MITFFQNSLMLRRLLTIAPHPTTSYSSNAGIKNRLKIYRQGNPELKNTKLTEKDFDDAEIDIMNNRIFEDHYKKEHERILSKIDLKRIERQHFDKQMAPNFLLWSEKQQIRDLHQSAPDEWTYEKLSESFPATPGVIKKIVKAQWRTKNKDIQKHDAHVVANWKAFMKNELNIPSHIRDHITRFSARNQAQRLSKGVSDLNISDKPSLAVPSTKSTQFVDIIRNYNVKNKNDPSPKAFVQCDENYFLSRPSETYVLENKRSNRSKMAQLTLEEMRKMGKIENGRGSELNDRESVKTGVVNPVDSLVIPRTSSLGCPDSITEEPDSIQMKIRIPSDKWKKGAVFRVKNCFYADDGEFLYKI